ncbi:MAG: UTP--glucose-1-phosphate uridylyltransferase GalU [Candidatus Thermoplasmatota archaeon]|jgi:UTP--glucose-1-phosphate uridylyltransferase|nr:UTP--glucose-1-phosphate uridylyltransferase GalU [Candidatus Thermoplasmatota archaeon]
MKIKKAVIPAAGLGTRFLPVTKSMPKEMLPIIDTPAIHYVVKEAIDSGLDDIIIITGRGKKPLEDYFDESPELEMHLKKNKKNDLLKTVREISSLVNIHYIRQKEPRGLPDALQTAEKHVGDEPFAVLLGDDITDSKKPCAKQLIDVFNKHKSSVIAVQNVPREKISRYGSVQTKSTSEKQLYLIKHIVEKPKSEEAPSTMAAIGRYVFTPEIFDCIHKTKPGVNNELQITDSINILTKSQKVYAYAFEGKRYDIGDKLGYVQAIIDFSLQNKEIKNDIKNYIRKIK